jgi:hypothetical protein
MTSGITRKALALAAVAAVTGTLLGSPGTASAAGPGLIRNAGDARCLDADLGTIGGDGTEVQLWDCHGDDNQLWTFEPGGLIRNGQSGRCLDAELAAIGDNGTKVQLWECHGEANQIWDYERDRGLLVNYRSGRCLDADPDGLGGNGTAVRLWGCHGQANQRWFF